jgi:hypothetical protein
VGGDQLGRPLRVEAGAVQQQAVVVQCRPRQGEVGAGRRDAVPQGRADRGRDLQLPAGLDGDLPAAGQRRQPGGGRGESRDRGARQWRPWIAHRVFELDADPPDRADPKSRGRDIGLRRALREDVHGASV